MLAMNTTFYPSQQFSQQTIFYPSQQPTMIVMNIVVHPSHQFSQQPALSAVKTACQSSPRVSTALYLAS